MTLKSKQMIAAIIAILAMEFIITNTFIHSKREFISGYNFKISKIRVSPTKRMIFYDTKGEKVYFWNYTVMDDENVSVGDSVYKAPCSEFLYIYRKDDKGEYREHIKVTPSGLFPHKWFCR